MIRVLLALTIALAQVACVYTARNVSQNRHGEYKNYPTSVEADRDRRSSRRKWALIASPLEIVGGLGLAALALYAPATTMADGDESVVDNLGDAGKDIAGRLLLAGVGGAIALGGVGDFMLGATDPLRSSPYVRHGELVAADRIDHLAPPRGPRLDLHVSNVLGSGGAGAGGGLGLAHWVSDRVRLRHAVSGETVITFGEHERRGGVTFDTTAELAFGRHRGGLVPTKSIGVYAGSGVWWTELAGSAPVVTGGLQLDLGTGTYRLGTRYLVGIDRVPSIDLGLHFEIGGD